MSAIPGSFVVEFRCPAMGEVEVRVPKAEDLAMPCATRKLSVVPVSEYRKVCTERDALRGLIERIRRRGIPMTARDEYRRGYGDALEIIAAIIDDARAKETTT